MTNRLPNPCLGATLSKVAYPTVWHGVRQPFLISNQSLTRYARFRKHNLIIDSEKDPPGPTFDDDAVKKLIRLYPEDPLYPILGGMAKIKKCKGTYVDGIHVDALGRLHTIFTHNPDTLRLSSKNPNLQNLPRTNSKSVYDRVKEMYVAAPGKTFLELDFKAIEAQIVAYLAGDKDMLRLSKLGIHAFMASHVLKCPVNLSWSDGDIKAYFAELKGRESVMYDTCKRVIYLSLYLGTPNKIQQEYPETFPTLKLARFYQDFFMDLFPSIRRWHWAVCREASAKGFVTAPSGFRMWFFESIGHKREGDRWVEELGREAKEVVASVPQHMAMCYSAQALAALDEDPLVREHRPLRLSIHDAILSEIGLDYVDDLAARKKAVMEQPLKCMPLPPEWNLGPYLKIETEAKRGNVWATMH